MSAPGRDIAASLVPRGTMARLDAYVALLIEANARQNLVAASTLPDVWQRHVLDSLQLADLATGSGPWIDIGSGAGLPGLVVAIATGRPTRLIEPRRLRAAFLAEAVARLGLASQVDIVPRRCEAVPPAALPAATISARAVAALSDLFSMAAHLAGPETQWLLPKGQRAADEVAAARRSWQGDFRLVPSRTESQAMIVDARAVRRRGQG